MRSGTFSEVVQPSLR